MENLKEEVAKPRKIALYWSEYVRVSEPIEIRFRPLNSGEVMEQALATLNAEERKVLAELNQQLANIRDRKKQLLALTHESQISEHGVDPCS